MEFRKESYALFLEDALARNYSIKQVKELSSKTDFTQEKAIYMRHDVDYSLDYALHMAEVETFYNVRTSYFVMTHSDFYSALSPHSQKIIKLIQRLGHEVGLHYVRGSNLSLQLDILESVTGRVHSIACHKPDQLNFVFTDRVNSYDPEIMQKLTYISDSSMAWRKHTPIEFIKTGQSFQCLTHPVWWMAKGGTMPEKLYTCATFSANTLGRIYGNEIAETMVSLEKRKVLT